MAETADGDDLPPPSSAYSPSDDELDELVGNATSDLTDAATGNEPEPTTAASGSESTEGTEPGQTAEGQEGAEGREPEGAEPTTALETPPEPARAADAPAGKPFRFKASGAEHQFHGVDELPDGSLRVSKDATPQFRRVLGSYVELQRTAKEERRNAQREIRRLQTERSDKDLEADAISGLHAKMLSMTPEERWVWAENYAANAKELELAVKQQQLERKQKALEEREKGPELLPEEAEEQAATAIQQEVHATFTRLFTLPEAKALTTEDRKKLWAKYQSRGARLTVRATEDDPVTGAKKGQLIFDDSDIVDDFNYLVDLRKQTGKTVTAAQRNQRLNADQGRRTPPPVVRGNRQPSSGGKKEQPNLRGQKKEFRKAFVAGDLDAKDD